MKNLLLIITAALLFFACKDDNPTDKSDEDISTEYTIEELESDPNWVEFTDFREVEPPCIYREVYQLGTVCKTENKLNELYKKSKEITDKWEDYCDEDNDGFEFNFADSTLLFFFSDIDGGSPKTERKIFYNQTKDKYVYILKYGPTVGTYEGAYWSEHIALPKISNNATFVFDTTLTWEYLENQ